MVLPVRCWISWRIVAAVRSGSSGRSATHSPLSGGPTLERSMPALADVKPSRCFTINKPGRMRDMPSLSLKINSTKRGSFSVILAISCAWMLGAMSAKLTIRPSALETIFWAMTTISFSSNCKDAVANADSSRSVTSSPACTSGIFGTANISMANIKLPT